MKFTYSLPIACVATLALGATVNVTVGPGLEYSPDSVTAAKGDVVAFHFGSGHNVVSGTFGNPCQANDVIYSGNPKDGDVFYVTVNNTDPVWIYCSVPHHCESGMAMVINPPSNETIDEYKQAASKASSSGSPAGVMGGVFNAPAGSSSSSSAASSATGAHSTATSHSSTAAANMTGTASASAASSTSSSSASKMLNSGSSIFVALAVALGFTVRVL